MINEIETVFETPWFKIEKDDSFPCLKGESFYRLVTPNGISILPVTNDGLILYIRQFRPAFNAYTLEIPAGEVDQGETPIKAGIRELYEETGYTSNHTSILANHITLITNRSPLTNTILIAQDIKKDKGHIILENIEPILTPIQEFEKMIIDGEFRQAIGIAAFGLAKMKGFIA